MSLLNCSSVSPTTPSCELYRALLVVAVAMCLAGCRATPQAPPTGVGSGMPVVDEAPVAEPSSDESGAPDEAGEGSAAVVDEGSVEQPPMEAESSGENSAGDEGGAPEPEEPVRGSEVVTAQVARCGTPPAPCGDGEYCARPLGECENFAVGSCAPIPMVCTRDFRPVCGCDGNTYANACGAAAAGVAVAREGDCESEQQMDIAPR